MAVRGTARGALAGSLATLIILGLIVIGAMATGVANRFLDKTIGGGSETPVSGNAPADPAAKGQAALVPTTSASNPATPTVAPPPIGNLPTEYLKAWESKRFSEMYGLLSDSAKQSIDEKRFIERYTAITTAATIQSITTRVGTAQASSLPNTQKVPFEVTLKTVRLGEFTESNVMPLVYEGGRWGVQWAPQMLFKDLTGDNLIRMFPLNPQRGSILDRQGRPLATQGYVVQIGLVKSLMKDQNAVIASISDFTKVSVDDINKKLSTAEPDWFVLIKEVEMSREEEIRQKLEPLEGVSLRHKSVRTYPNGEVAAHVIGFVSRITEEDLQTLAEKGYEADDFIGRDGIEAWAEDQLAGQRGGKLAVVNQKGEVVKVIAEQPVKRGADVYLTIDIDIQKTAEEDLTLKGADKLPGSIVIMDPRDNAILAMASFPRYDPNKFVTGMTQAEWDSIINNNQRPLLDRPAMAAYPTGSIFKVIPYTAAVEKLGYGPFAPTDCPGSYKIPGTNVTLNDLHPEGHGTLPFPQTLTESCNVPYYDIAYKLNQIDPYFLPNWARQHGLGQKTGTIGLDETSGIVPDPKIKKERTDQEWFTGDAVEFGIGQGLFEATPLQMANVYSTIANKGVLRTPLLVRKITSVDGQIIKAYAAEEKGKLPIKAATFDAMLDGLIKTATTEKGTAYYAFKDFKTVSVAAKTGSADNQSPNAHAWFAGWAPAESPQYVAIVMIEGGQAGGTVAAPRARQMFDFLFPAKAPPTAVPGAPAAPQPAAKPAPTQAAPSKPTAPAAAPTVKPNVQPTQTAPAKPAAPTPTPKP